jgi:hypothetical protein
MPKKGKAITYEEYVKGLQELEPEEQLSLIELISARLKQNLRKREAKHSILELEGLGAGIWQGIDPQGYVTRERESWD